MSSRWYVRAGSARCLAPASSVAAAMAGSGRFTAVRGRHAPRVASLLAPQQTPSAAVLQLRRYWRFRRYVTASHAATCCRERDVVSSSPCGELPLLISEMPPRRLSYSTITHAMPPPVEGRWCASVSPPTSALRPRSALLLHYWRHYVTDVATTDACAFHAL